MGIKSSPKLEGVRVVWCGKRRRTSKKKNAPELNHGGEERSGGPIPVKRTLRLHKTCKKPLVTQKRSGEKGPLGKSPASMVGGGGGGQKGGPKTLWQTCQKGKKQRKRSHGLPSKKKAQGEITPKKGDRWSGELPAEIARPRAPKEIHHRKAGGKEIRTFGVGGRDHLCTDRASRQNKPKRGGLRTDQGVRRRDEATARQTSGVTRPRQTEESTTGGGGVIDRQFSASKCPTK